MLISRRQTRPVLPDLFINNEKIEFVDKASNLGIIFQSDLEWSSQVNSQCGRIYAVLRSLRLTAGMLPISTKLMLFKSLLLPHFTYGSELIINASAASNVRLKISLNHCVRWVFNLTRYSSVTPYHRQLLGCSFDSFSKIRCYVTLFKIIHYGPNYLREKLLPFRGSRNPNYVLLRHNTSHYGGSFFVRAIQLWNLLPVNIKSLHSLTRFRSECVKWLNERN